MKILVTGADGFIGSHLVEALVRDGRDVRAFVHYNSFNSWGWLDYCAPDVKGRFDVCAGDVRDPHGVRTAMKGCDAVLHLAALIAIPYSYHSPDTYIETNIKGTLNVLQAARDLEVSRIVHTSTSEVYGTATFVPIDEGHPLQAQSPYAASKIGADQIALSFHASFGTPVAVLRPFNTYGPRQSARAVLPAIITQIASGARQIRLGSLHPTRDFSFVTDTVRGYLAALGSDAAVGRVVNLGSGFEISIGDAARAVADVMEAQVEIVTDPQRLRPAGSEVDRLWASNDKARALLAWAPYGGLDGFRRGLSETIHWFRQPANSASYKPDAYNCVIAETLAELGANLVLVDRPGVDQRVLSDALSARWPVRIDLRECDLESEQARGKLVAAVSDAESGLDVLINNAAFVGTSPLQGWATDLEHQTIETWLRAFEVNVTAVFDLCKGFAPLLRHGASGSIVNVASIYGLLGPDYSLYAGTDMGNPAAYAASKGGLIQLTRWLATTLAPDVRVNVISPGGVFRNQPDAFVRRYEARTPLGRMATEDDLRGAAAFLASDLSKYVTGQNLVVDGGWSIW
jgi:dTDP-glucose 4,6-dehydratase